MNHEIRIVVDHDDQCEECLRMLGRFSSTARRKFGHRLQVEWYERALTLRWES